MRVLIAEDDFSLRKIVQRLLTKWGYEVEAVCDGEEAWQSLQRPDAPSMVLLDWMMPGMDGVDICRRLRQTKRDIRPYVILLTGKDDKSDLIKGISAGADDYVTKPFDPDELRVRILSGQRVLALQVESLTIMEALRKQASHDYLTGLPNRATIMGMLRREFARGPRSGRDVSVVMADVDHFKSINDGFGHHVGDAVLTEVAKRMAVEMRSYEIIGRYGGEEFMAVLSDCDTEGAFAVAERLRLSVEAKPFESSSRCVPMTMSFGVASTAEMPSATQETLVQFADAAMYRAKKAGRNRTECAVKTPGLALQS
jgi:two-component system cell cycle response regulator